jgi:hypothetical protein
MLTFADMVKLFSNKLSGLGGRRFALVRVFPGSFHRLSFRHGSSPESVIYPEYRAGLRREQSKDYLRSEDRPGLIVAHAPVRKARSLFFEVPARRLQSVRTRLDS